MIIRIGVAVCAVFAATAQAQTLFSVTGTRIPPELVRVNYGKLPASIAAFDLNICNQSGDKRAVTASQIYQALAEADVTLQPLGRQVMLALILRNQQHTLATITTVVLNVGVGVLSALGAARTGISGDVLAGAAVGSAVGQQLLNNLRPVLSADQVARYENQVLEPALVLDNGTCVERTVFALSTQSAPNKVENLTFHIR
jgi:hypothetical protein